MAAATAAAVLSNEPLPRRHHHHHHSSSYVGRRTGWRGRVGRSSNKGNVVQQPPSVLQSYRDEEANVSNATVTAATTTTTVTDIVEDERIEPVDDTGTGGIRRSNDRAGGAEVSLTGEEEEEEEEEEAPPTPARPLLRWAAGVAAAGTVSLGMMTAVTGTTTWGDGGPLGLGLGSAASRMAAKTEVLKTG